MKKNIFVIGDLVIDHTIFIKTPIESVQASPGEIVYKVIRRQDMAGGAANSARVLASLNEGHTYLWGVIGSSYWGSYRTILKLSQLLDNALSNIEFRGVQDETDAQMNTITRLILEDEDSRLKRTIRFDDVGHVHVSDAKRQTVMYHLRSVHTNRDPLTAILINDLDKKCLTKEVVKEIAEFAESNEIPLFVDPKRERSKYMEIKGTAILPNLMEWCYLTNESLESRYEYWRNNLDNPEVLTEMANLSFRYLGNFKYHIITCDRLGAVIIAPHPERQHLYAVYRAKAEQAHSQTIDSPLGCGDIMSAIFAAEYDKERENKEGTEMALAAFHRANITVGCYCDMSWHRMPDSAMVASRLNKSQPWNPNPLAEPSIGMLYLPHKGGIVLSEFDKVLPRVYSNDVKFKGRLKDLVEEISAQTQQVTPKSIMLGAPSGAGKSRIIAGLLTLLPQRGIPVSNMLKADLVDLVEKYPESLIALMQQLDHPQVGVVRCFVIVDEAYGDHFGKDSIKAKKMLELLQGAHTDGIRFLFVDSMFHSENKQKVEIMPDISTRCAPFELPGITARPGDIPYLIADKLLECAEKEGKHVIRVEGKLLLSVTDRILETNHPRRQLNTLGTAYENAKKTHVPEQGTILIRFSHLADKTGSPVRSSLTLSPDVFTISR